MEQPPALKRTLYRTCGQERLSRYSNSLRTGRSGDRIPVAERHKTRVCELSIDWVAGSNPTGGMDICVVCNGKRQTPGKSGQRTKYG